MLEYKVVPGEPIPLGRRWEHNATRIVFDVSAWVKAFGAGSVRLLHQRQNDAAPYPVSVTRTDADGTPNAQTGTLVLWDVSRTDTAQKCQYGKAELRYYAGTEGAETFLAKSEIYKTVVLDALGGSLADAPESEGDWLATLLGFVGNVDSQSEAAQGAAENAQSSAADAADGANTAHAAAIAARAAQKAAEAALDATPVYGAATASEMGLMSADDKAKLDGIQRSAEANVLEGVSVNGSAVSVSGKIAALSVPTKVSDLTNDSGFATRREVSGKLDASRVGAAGGVAALDENGIILTSQLPSYVDDALEYASASAFPATGESGKIYVALDTNLTYRWTGSAYTEISPSLALGETSSTAYRGDRGKIAYDHSQTVTGNPHGVTKSDVGLSNVDNTSDADKPVSTAQRAALDLKVDKASGKGLSTNDYTTAEKNAVATIGNKVDKVSGKGLSTNDYTDAEKSKLSGIASGATANAPATAAPLMDGAAVVGTSAKYAREDHRHPTDTSRASADDLTALQALTYAWIPYMISDGIPDFIISANAEDEIYSISGTNSGRGGTRGVSDPVIFANRAGTTNYPGCYAIIGKTEEAVTLTDYNAYGQSTVSSQTTPAGNVVYVSRNKGSFVDANHTTRCVVNGQEHTLKVRANAADNTANLSVQFLAVVDAILFGDIAPVGGTGSVIWRENRESEQSRISELESRVSALET